MATEYNSASEYIGHHLSFLTKPAEGGGFWTINVDSVVTATVLGVLGLAFMRWIVSNASTTVPGKVQAFVEVVLEKTQPYLKELVQRVSY